MSARCNGGMCLGSIAALIRRAANRWSASQINRIVTLRIEEAEDGLGASEIAKGLKIGRASVYRVLEAG
jgi:DNA invertase Pin-like site-specific DNA recombinase